MPAEDVLAGATLSHKSGGKYTPKQKV